MFRRDVAQLVLRVAARGEDFPPFLDSLLIDPKAGITRSENDEWVGLRCRVSCERSGQNRGYWEVREMSKDGKALTIFTVQFRIILVGLRYNIVHNENNLMRIL